MIFFFDFQIVRETRTRRSLSPEKKPLSSLSLSLSLVFYQLGAAAGVAAGRQRIIIINNN